MQRKPAQLFSDRESFPTETADKLQADADKATREYQEIQSILEKARAIQQQGAEAKAFMQMNFLRESANRAKTLVAKSPERNAVEREIAALEKKITENLTFAQWAITEIPDEEYKRDLQKFMDMTPSHPKRIKTLDAAAWRNLRCAQVESWKTCLVVVAASAGINLLLSLCSKNHVPDLKIPDQDPNKSFLISQLHQVYKHTQIAAESYQQLIWKRAELRTLPPVDEKRHQAKSLAM